MPTKLPRIEHPRSARGEVDYHEFVAAMERNPNLMSKITGEMDKVSRKTEKK